MKGFAIWMVILFPVYLVAQNDTVRDDKASDFNLNKPERVEWFRNTGEGLFIHLGVDAPLGIVISHSLVGASDEYVNRYFNQLPQFFDPYRWDPHAIAVLARLAGMKYIVFTTKHHSGFCMWDTRTTPFNILHTPYHKDLLKEFVEATRAEGLGVGFYFSPEDFYFLHTHGIPISRTDVRMDSATRQAYDEYTRQQCEELMTRYGKIDILFIDGEPKEVVKRTCWRLQPDLLITRGAFRTPEQVLPGEKSRDPWLSCITMGTAWQYQPTNERYKSGNQLIRLAIEARAKGGSLLLNVGPKPDGELPIEQEERLREMAAWYFINHECMDSVRPWIVSHEEDIWYMAGGGHTLYAIVTNTGDWKEGDRKTFYLHSVKSTAATALSVLGQNSRLIEYRQEDVSCRYRQNADGLEVSVVKAQRIYDDHHWPNPIVIKLENVEPLFNEDPEVRTGEGKADKQGILLSGQLSGDTQRLAERACFFYRPYKGQTETLYAGEWKRTAWTKILPDGSFQLRVPELDPSLSYEYRAAADLHQVLINGEDKIYHAPPPPSPAPPSVIPLPQQGTTGKGPAFVFRPSTVIGYSDTLLKNAAEWLDQYQFAYTGVHLRICRGLTAGIFLAIDTVLVSHGEGYRLEINKDHIMLIGHDAAGVLYGLQTLRQLWQPEKGTISAAQLTIDDYPRYAWRGMHLDVSRHFFPVSFIKKYIDLLVLYKLNAFHWHLTDDQGWRIEIPEYPRLQSVAAWRNETLIGHKREQPHRFDGKRYGGYYTQQEIREIVQYAADRQVTVLPEIEMPGHASAVLAAYPGLGCTGGPYKTATFWGVFDDVFCAGNDSVFTFLQTVLDEVMNLFPSAYIHIGGDECPKTRWKVCPRCQQRIRQLGLKDEQELQSYFIRRIEQYVRSKGRHIVGWDEILEGGLAPDATVMSWRGEEGGLAASKAGHRVIMTPESHLYFDYYQSLDPEEPLAAGGYTPLRKVYGYTPMAHTADTAVHSRIYGIQGTLWTEYLSTPAQVEYMLLPRAAAMAELAWTGSSGDYAGFLNRFRLQEKLLHHLRVHYADRFDEITWQSCSQEDKIWVTLQTDLPAAQIRYTTDGSAPGSDSRKYQSPFLLDHTCTLKARLFIQGHPVGRVLRQYYDIHRAVGADVRLLHLPIPKYDPGPQALLNGIEGSRLYNDGQWLGWAGEDLDATIDLGSSRTIHRVGINLLNYHWQKMWAPRCLQFFLSEDGIHFKEIYRQTRFTINGINKVRYSFPPVPARYIKVTATNQGILPEGSYGAGGKALLLADEIIID